MTSPANDNATMVGWFLAMLFLLGALALLFVYYAAYGLLIMFVGILFGYEFTFWSAFGIAFCACQVVWIAAKLIHKRR